MPRAFAAERRVLDLGTGPGYVAARAVERGADALGIDVTRAMVDLASRTHPRLTFQQASATELPFPDGSFDAVVGNLVILHVGEPELVAGESSRVLVPNGRVAFSTWDTPERSPLFGAIFAAVADAGVDPPADLPAGPAFFRFADDDEFARLLTEAGFADVRNDVAASSSISAASTSCSRPPRGDGAGGGNAPGVERRAA